jgi:hypothetical protein
MQIKYQYTVAYREERSSSAIITLCRALRTPNQPKLVDAL